jgi:two-component system NtrC family sensor kinase
MREGHELSDAEPPVADARTGQLLIGQLASGIAHEIKTPTQYVSDNVRFLQETFADLMSLIAAYRREAESLAPTAHQRLAEVEAKLDLDFLVEEVPRALEQSAEGMSRIAAIVFAINELSHPDQDQARDADLNKLVRSAMTVCSGEWKSAAELKLELADGLPTLQCYPGPLSQVLINLVVNAVHAIQARGGDGEPGRIVVSTRLAAPDTVEITVRDNGIGMPAHVRARIFERYFTTKARGKGTGQGLALAQDIIAGKHGGRLSFETALGEGTTFCVCLPVAVSPRTLTV